MADPTINDPALWLPRFPWPAEDGHKHDRGRLYVVSGGASHTGAARMAARAGLRIGAGLVTVLSPPSALLVNAMSLEAVMVAAFNGPYGLVEKADKASAAVIGPAAGVGEATALNVLALARTDAALVLDADALTSFADAPDRLFQALQDPSTAPRSPSPSKDGEDEGQLSPTEGGGVPAKRGRGSRHILTPHEGEFERLFPGQLKDKGRLAAAREAARRSGAVVLLKGAETVIAHPDGRAILNRHASPFLATAGSGDTLAGLIGGLLAQGMSTFDAAPAAAWIHGEAARRFGPGLTAEDLPGEIPPILADLYAQRGTAAAAPPLA